MERRAVNPWTWQDQFGFSQSIEVKGAERVLICAGQTSVDENGTPINEGDIAAQANKALDNLETVLKQAGFSLADVVRLNILTTNVDQFMGAAPALLGRMMQANCKPASTLIGVARLAFPQLLIELEATAMA
jgi:enamine deaminase RidA (YjgF/YER057c/UK114 family)